MDLFSDAAINPAALDSSLLAATSQLEQVVGLAYESKAALIQDVHFLMMLARLPNGPAADLLNLININADAMVRGLLPCVRTSSKPPAAELTRATLHGTALQMFERAAQLAAEAERSTIDEACLVCACLETAPGWRNSPFAATSADTQGILSTLKRRYLEKRMPIAVYADGKLLTQSFSPAARKLIEAAHRGAESLGYEKVDLRHLLQTMLEREQGVLHTAVCLQGLRPAEIHANISLSLNMHARHVKTTIAVEQDNHDGMLQEVLLASAEVAARESRSRVGDAELVIAMLSSESLVCTVLRDAKLSLEDAVRFARRLEPDPTDEEEFEPADIGTVKAQLERRLVGQDDAIQRILPYIQCMRFGFTSPGRPVGVFLFCGASGTGKTEMAKELARGLYGSEDNLIFLEMGQFKSKESMSIFVGAPPGYVGYGQGKLTNGLRDKPRSVVLFDEVEKADGEVLDTLLRFLDEGRIDDPAGPIRDGTQCCVILTSNAGAPELGALDAELRDDPNRNAVIRGRMREIFEAKNFRVEFLNRVDELILFKQLDREDYAEIAQRALSAELMRLREETGVDAQTEPGAAEAIGAYAAELGEGARAVHRLIRTRVITPIIGHIVKLGGAKPRLRVSLEIYRSAPEAGPDIGPIIDLVPEVCVATTTNE